MPQPIDKHNIVPGFRYVLLFSYELGSSDVSALIASLLIEKGLYISYYQTSIGTIPDTYVRRWYDWVEVRRDIEVITYEFTVELLDFQTLHDVSIDRIKVDVRNSIGEYIEFDMETIEGVTVQVFQEGMTINDTPIPKALETIKDVTKEGIETIGELIQPVVPIALIGLIGLALVAFIVFKVK